MDNLIKVQRFGIIWYQEWLPKITCSWVVSIFVGTPFLRFPNVFINFHECANLIISILDRWMKLLCLTFLSNKYFKMSFCWDISNLKGHSQLFWSHGNHAISHSSNGIIFRAILLPIAGGPTKLFDAHEKLSWGRKTGLIRPLGTTEFKCFYFWIIDSVTHFVGIARKNWHYDGGLRFEIVVFPDHTHYYC